MLRSVEAGPIVALRGADADAFRRLLREIEAGTAKRVVFAVPMGTSWPLPLYKLALLTAPYVRGRHLEFAELALVTPESSPLALFGSTARETVGRLLRAADRSAHGHTLSTCLPAGDR